MLFQVSWYTWTTQDGSKPHADADWTRDADQGYHIVASEDEAREFHQRIKSEGVCPITGKPLAEGHCEIRWISDFGGVIAQELRPVPFGPVRPVQTHDDAGSGGTIVGEFVATPDRDRVRLAEAFSDASSFANDMLCTELAKLGGDEVRGLIERIENGRLAHDDMGLVRQAATAATYFALQLLIESAPTDADQ